jgi:hypothetical protein
MTDDIKFPDLRLDDLVGAPTLKWALRYASVGMGVVPTFKHNGKWIFQLGGVKSATTDPTLIERWWVKIPHADILWAGANGRLVIDLDRKNGKDGIAVFERCTGLTIADLVTPIASSIHGGGLHLYFVTNGVVYDPLENVGGDGVDFCAMGPGPDNRGNRGVVLPGPDNGREWLKPLSGPWMPVPAFYEDLMRQRHETRHKPNSGGGGSGGESHRARQSFTGETRRARRALSAAYDALEKAPTGRRDRASSEHALRIGSLVAAGELDEELSRDALAEAAGRNTAAAPDFVKKVIRGFDTGLGSPAPQKTRAPSAAWLEHAIIDDNGAPLPILANALAAIRYTSELAGALAYDELLRAAVLVAELPIIGGAREITGRPLPRPVIDEDVTQLQEWLQHAGMPRIGRETVHQAVDRHARDFPFHKLRDWLDGLKWDETPRLEKWAITYLGAPDTEYHRAIGKMFLIAMVARILEPGCQADYVIILQSDQGEQKSGALRILASDEYFSDNLPNIHNKDSSQHVRGIWLIEIGELSAMNRSDIESWKAFITRRTERYRPPYGRRETHEPRQCVFAGSTNKEEYLHDETGNRRFWPLPARMIDLEALGHDREQLFAEAVNRYRAGDHWWPTREFEQEHIKPEQDARFEEDAWQPIIAAWLDALNDEQVKTINGLKEPKTPDITPNKLLVHVVAQHALEVKKDRLGTTEARRIRRVLYRLGWRQPARVGKGRFYYRSGYLPQELEEESEES